MLPFTSLENKPRFVPNGIRKQIGFAIGMDFIQTNRGNNLKYYDGRRISQKQRQNFRHLAYFLQVIHLKSQSNDQLSF